MSDEKDLIWVSKKLAEEYKNLDSVEEQEKAVKKIIANKKLNLDQENELLSESLLQFKSVCLAHKKELSKVYEEQDNILYKMWEDMGDVNTKISKHAKEVASSVSPISKEVAQLNSEVLKLKKQVDGLHLYLPERLVELTQMVSRMGDKELNALKKLLNYAEKG